MCKPYVLVKRPQPKRTKKQHLHCSVEARVLAKDNKRVQWEQRCTERRLAEEALSSAGPIALFLHETDVVAADADAVFSLFYESYEGYTLYSTQQGRCAVHGARGCLRLGGKYVSFPDEEQARRAVLYFQERGWKPHQIMERGMAEGAYVCLNEQGKRPASRRIVEGVLV
jgi:hypothetical protein